MKTEQAYDKIMGSLFKLKGEEIDLCDALDDLCSAINAEEETDWNIGECEECSLDSLIIGAFWAFTDWHAGQSSPEYATLCNLGSIFSPGCTSGPEPDSGEMIAYEQVDAYFLEKTA